MPEEIDEKNNTGKKISDETTSDEMSGDEMGSDEIDGETTGQASAEQIGKFSSPGFLMEAIIILPIAIILDLIGIILFILSFFGIGIPLSFILDLIGLALIGGWMLIRKGHITTTRSAGKLIKKSSKKLSKRLGLTFLGELIPFFGDIAPCWTLAVFFELKNN